MGSENDLTSTPAKAGQQRPLKRSSRQQKRLLADARRALRASVLSAKSKYPIDTITPGEVQKGLVARDFSLRKRSQIPDKVLDTFLEYYAKSGSYVRAAKACGLSVRTLRELEGLSSTFCEALDQARQESVAEIEAAARERAVHGVEKDVYYKGEVVGQEREYSDRLAELLLIGNMPEKYGRDRFGQGASTSGGVNIVIQNFSGDKKSPVIDVEVTKSGKPKQGPDNAAPRVETANISITSMDRV